MNILFVSTYLFLEEGGKYYSLPSSADAFFEKYLGVFDNVRVLGVPVSPFLDRSKLVEITNPRITIRIIKSNARPKEIINDIEVYKSLKEEILKADALIVNPTSRKGALSIKLAKKYNKPYLIEMTGDGPHALSQTDNVIKKLYSPFFYYKTRRAIKNAKFGLYVSNEYLQKRYPISGEICSCADVVLKNIDESVLEKRLHRIAQFDQTKRVDIALIGFYQGKLKGIDTAIKALSRLPEAYHLHILGNGTLQNRDKWITYGEKMGIKNRIHFPSPLPSSDDVLLWLDSMDFFILPTKSEGFGRCVAEAMSRGCPCFASNVCTMPELLEKECLFPVGDYVKLANLLESYSSNHCMMKKTSIRNFEESKEYEFEYLHNKRDLFLSKFKHYAERQINSLKENEVK